jgi:F-type H+-transporting ATPase subunit a
MDHISIKANELFHIGSFTVTNTMLTSWLVTIALIVFGLIIRLTIKERPGRIQNFAEWIIENLISFFENIAGSREIARKFFPFVATIFFFVLLSNWSGILPGVGSIGIFEHHGEEEVFIPLFRSVYSDLNMTLALAIITVVYSHIVGLIHVGFFSHIGKFLNFHSPITLFAGILEIIGEVSKIISLSFRLFGNVFAGEVLLIIIATLVPYIAPLPFLGLEIFVGLIQSLIFAVLAMVAFSAFSKAESH